MLPADSSSHVLLIVTVGGTPEPIAKALRHWKPARVIFVPSRGTEPQVGAALALFAEQSGQPLGPGCYETRAVDDPEDLAGCLETLRALDVDVRTWLDRGPDFEVVADFTAGTKCMTAALALQARRWPCRYSYVGGTTRLKDGVGVVATGSERVVHAANPWDALGFQAVEDFITLFNRLDFAPAAAIAERARDNTSDPGRKRELNALKVLAEAYEAWDRFDHKRARNELKTLMSFQNDLTAVLGADRARRLRDDLDQHRAHLAQLVDTPLPNRPLILDLLANAARCRQRGRHDDAVARLYRAIEAIAQLQLDQKHGLKTDNVPLEGIPDPLREALSPKAEDGFVKCGLQDAYALLTALGDDLGRTFQELGLDDPQRSPLVTRNQSILAHGFAPVSDKVYPALMDRSLKLLAAGSSDLPEFPSLGPLTA